MPRSNTDWRSSAPLENLKIRACILSEIRAFFAAGEVLEVETPVLSRAALSDPAGVVSSRVEPSAVDG